MLFRIDVVGQGPKLRNQHEIEQADPKEKRDAELKVHLSENVKDGKIGNEKCSDAIDQSDAAGAARKRAVERNDQQEKHGLSGARIPLASRIICACDAFHAMTSERPYRTATSREAALTELRSSAGSQFDPAVVDALVSEVS